MFSLALTTKYALPGNLILDGCANSSLCEGEGGGVILVLSYEGKIQQCLAGLAHSVIPP